MSKTTSIVLQVFGYQLLIVMITTIRIQDILVFDPPFSGRAVLGVAGMILLLAGSLFVRKGSSPATKEKGEPNV